MRKQILTISVDQTVLEHLDAERGLIKRSTWVNETLKKLLASDDRIRDTGDHSNEEQTVIEKCVRPRRTDENV
jgi:metal-responsive CopG/Arc/MetJ family transcriptional regulator